jgi:predicted amidohydrolase
MRIWFLLLLVLPAAAEQLRIAVVQMAIAPAFEENRDRIIAGIGKGATAGARVVVFPEGALSDYSGKAPHGVAAAVEAIRQAAQSRKVYVLFGGWTWSEQYRKAANWMKAIAPDGGELLHYDKIWDVHEAPNPAVFSLDGVPASAIICADRWLRAVEELPIQQGAQVSFELSNNYDSEWAPELEWYWYVPRAVRNNVYVVFANSANRSPGKPEPGGEPRPRHGHSAIVAPDGTLVAAAHDDLETVLIADLDLQTATRAEALARRAHPALGRFWEAGLDLLRGRSPAGAPLTPLESPESELAVGVAQIPDGEMAPLGALLRQAAERRLDLVALTASPPLSLVSELARRYGLTIVFSNGDTVCVAGPDGAVLTRHRALSTGGTSLSTMWFRVKGVPAVVSAGRDALWNEIAELAAVAGARLHVNLSDEAVPDHAALIRRRQSGAVFSSFLTLTVMANPAHSAIWDDLTGREETRAEVRGLPRPDTGPVRVYSAFSANLAAEAGKGVELITVRRRIPGNNPHYPLRTARFQPGMDSWYALGGRLLLQH